jgi:hypothetical protein
MQKEIIINELYKLKKPKVLFSSFGIFSREFTRIGVLNPNEDVLVLDVTEWVVDPFYSYAKVLTSLGIGWVEVDTSCVDLHTRT